MNWHSFITGFGSIFSIFSFGQSYDIDYELRKLRRSRLSKRPETDLNSVVNDFNSVVNDFNSVVNDFNSVVQEEISCRPVSVKRRKKP